MSKSTKADRIRTLYAAGKSTTEIAALVGCSDSYVRVCARQRVPGGPGDYGYRRRLESLADTYGDRDAAHRAGKAKYREMLAAGHTTIKASYASGSAYSAELRKSILRNIPKVPA